MEINMIPILSKKFYRELYNKLRLCYKYKMLGVSGNERYRELKLQIEKPQGLNELVDACVFRSKNGGGYVCGI